MLGVIGYVVRNEAVTQFVLFTMCALVADYFMQMTFFITVLSIDIQRLELAEVLMQGTRAPGAAATPHADMPRRLRMDHPRSGTARLVHMLYRLWCMRSPRLVHALAIVLAAGTALVMYARSCRLKRGSVYYTIARMSLLMPSSTRVPMARSGVL